jgi:hypothetical protein
VEAAAIQLDRQAAGAPDALDFVPVAAREDPGVRLRPLEDVCIEERDEGLPQLASRERRACGEDRLDGRHPSTPSSEGRVTNRKDSAVHRVQGAEFQPLNDRVTLDAGVEELPS